MKTKFIDLGLNVKWASNNVGANSPEEVGSYFYRTEAVEQYTLKLPTKGDVQELLEKCSWERKENGYKVTGPNGNSVFIPASGYKYQESHMYPSDVYLWTSSLTHGDFCIALNNNDLFMTPGYYYMPVRLVKSI